MKRSIQTAGLALLSLLLVLGVGAGAYLWLTRPTPVAITRMPPLPPGWPTILHLGMSDGLDGAQKMRATAPFAMRYQYLAGGANTGKGWATWNPNGSFVTRYVEESARNGMLPVFTYYMLTQSAPGLGNGPSEAAALQTNISNRETMRSYFLDLRLFFERAGALRNQQIVLHVEPDLWGFLQQRAGTDDATAIPVLVASTGIPELGDLPDNLSGFAQAIVRLRDRFAPNVLLGYHLSAWATGTDPFLSNVTDATIDRIAVRSFRFYESLDAQFDLAFGEFSDRDAAFKEAQYRDRGRSWWDAADFTRHARLLARFVDLTGLRVVLWQIPYGNTKMRAQNNTWNHYQDNRVEWLLDDPSGTHLRQYLDAGVIGLLFGRGADGPTDASDAARDGITDPPPINGNDRASLSADDDGGFFRERAMAYYAAGALPLPQVPLAGGARP